VNFKLSVEAKFGDAEKSSRIVKKTSGTQLGNETKMEPKGV
jgi:hypothetical protein